MTRHRAVAVGIKRLQERREQLAREVAALETALATQVLQERLLTALVDVMGELRRKTKDSLQQGDCCELLPAGLQAMQELIQQEAQLLQQLPPSGGALASEMFTQLQDDSLPTVAPLTDPLAVFRDYALGPPPPEAPALATMSGREVAERMRQVVLEVAVHLHLAAHAPMQQQEQWQHIRSIWDSVFRVAIACMLSGNTSAADAMYLYNLQTLQQDAVGADQDARTAALVPKLQLTLQQHFVIATGWRRVFERLIAAITAERQQLQAQPLPSAPGVAAAAVAAELGGAAAPAASTTPAGWAASEGSGVHDQAGACTAGSGRSMADLSADEHSSSPGEGQLSRVSSSGLAAWGQQHAAQQRHVRRLEVLLQKEYLARTTAASWLAGCLTLKQWATAIVLSWPFLCRPCLLAQQIAAAYQPPAQQHQD